MAISLTIDGAQVALKKGSSIEYVSENRIFTDADDYSLEIELPLAECPQNIAVFGRLTRKDVDTDKIFFNAVLQDTKFRKVGAQGRRHRRWQKDCREIILTSFKVYLRRNCSPRRWLAHSSRRWTMRSGQTLSAAYGKPM